MTTGPISILLVEDSPSDAALLRESLNEFGPGQFQVIHARTSAQGLAHLAQQRFDVLLLDLSLPDSPGEECLVRARAAAPELPMVVLTSAADKNIGSAAARSGIQDYLPKSLADGAQTARAIRCAIERQRMETDLRREKEFLAGILERAAQPFAVGYPDGRIGLFNCAFAQLTGYTDDELRAMDCTKTLTPPEWREPERRQLEQLQRTGQPVRYQKEYLRKDGRRVPIELLVHVVRDAGGKPEYYYSFLSDITERKQTESALRQSREDLARAQEVGQIGWWRLDTRRNSLTWSDESYRIFGVPKGTALTYETFLGTIHPDDRPYVDTQWQAALRGDPYDLEHRILADGQVKWVREKAYLEFDEAGALLGGFGIVQDITARKQAEEALRASDEELRQRVAELQTASAELRRARDELELRVAERTTDLSQSVEALQAEIGHRQQAEQALRESEERYRTLFESAPVGIAISNYHDEVIAFNRCLCDLAGVTPEEARTLRASDFHALPGQRRRLLAQVRKHGRIKQREALLRRKDGSRILGLLHMEEVRLGQEQVLLTIVQDITKQKQNEWHVEGIRELLELFATQTSREAYLDSVVRFLREWSGCRCAGIRLVEADGRIPYVTSLGYSRAFLKLENCLSLDTADCPCSRIFRGRALASDAQFTSPKGAFFCNHAGAVGEQFCADPAKRSQAACLQAHYDSLAHTPIRYHGQLFGTIHLADRREDRFPPETISFIESIAPLIGEALHRFQVEESLVESEQRFRSMFERHAAAMLLVEPETGAIEDANPAAAAFYGYTRERLQAMKVEQINTLPPPTAAAQRVRALRGDQSCFVVPHRLASGEIRTVEVHSSPIKVKGRSLLFSIIHDVTERNRLEKQILDIAEIERQRIGQDLHDSLGQVLTGAALLSKALAHRLEAKGIAEADVAEEVVRAVNGAIGQTRAIAHGLFPAELSAAGLAIGLKELAAETTRRSGISCRLRADRGVLIGDASVVSHLFRIAQEAISNAIRHGKPRHIALRLARRGEQVLLEIRDDGKGLSAHSGRSNGLGLRTMKYRAGLIGAQLAVNSSNGQGTVVSCLVPVRSARPPEPA